MPRSAPNLGFEPLDRDRFRIVAEVLCVEMAVADFVGRPELEALASRPGRYPARLTRSPVQMPLSDEARSIARLGEEFGNARFGFAQAQVVGDHAVRVGVLAGQDDGPSRTAHRRVGQVVLEQEPLGGQLVQMRRLDVGIAHASHCLSPHLIGEQEQDVQGSFGLLGARSAAQGPEQGSA